MGSSNLKAMKLAHLKKAAAEQMARGNYGKAADRYSAAMSLLAPSEDPALLRLLLSNRSAALLKAGRQQAALQDAAAAVRLAPGWAKGHWRRGRALAALHRWPEAVAAFLEAYCKSERGSAEQGECEQQLVATL
ncbi:hypothetical protein OEZ86_004411 [Tetradesmus obliquus]|nr:hypothetical protein OEZ86_004411 [Tetradesmus obliquus]